MKRFVALVLALMLCLSLCACGAGAGSPEKAVEKAFAKYDNVQDMYKALGMDFEAGLKKDLMDEFRDESLMDLKEDFLEDWPEIFSDMLDGEGDMVASLIGADKLEEYREKIEGAASIEEFVDLFVEVYMLYYDTYLAEVRKLSFYDDFDDKTVVEKVDNIVIKELEGEEYNEVLEDFAHDYTRADSVYLFDVSDIEAAYAVLFIITFSDGDTYAIDFDDGYYVLETSEGCFLYK